MNSLYISSQCRWKIGPLIYFVCVSSVNYSLLKHVFPELLLLIKYLIFKKWIRDNDTYNISKIKPRHTISNIYIYISQSIEIKSPSFQWKYISRHFFVQKKKNVSNVVKKTCLYFVTQMLLKNYYSRFFDVLFIEMMSLIFTPIWWITQHGVYIINYHQCE